MAKTPEEKKELSREAAQLAKAEGLAWKELPRERRKEFKQKVRDNKRAQRRSGASA